jgi:hypothetical protein
VEHVAGFQFALVFRFDSPRITDIAEKRGTFAGSNADEGVSRHGLLLCSMIATVKPVRRHWFRFPLSISQRSIYVSVTVSKGVIP